MNKGLQSSIGYKMRQILDSLQVVNETGGELKKIVKEPDCINSFYRPEQNQLSNNRNKRMSNIKSTSDRSIRTEKNFVGTNELQNGIIMAEILSEPLAKRSTRRGNRVNRNYL